MGRAKPEVSDVGYTHEAVSLHGTGAPPRLVIFLVGLSGAASLAAAAVYMPGSSVIVAIAVILGLVIFLNPTAGYCLVLVAIAFRATDLDILTLSESRVKIADLLFLPTVSGWLCRRALFSPKRLPFHRNPVNLYIIVFAWWVMVSASWSAGIPGSLSKLLQLFQDLLLFYMTIDLIEDEDTLKRILFFWLISGVIAAMFGFAQVIGAERIRRASSTMHGNLGYCEFMLYPLFFGCTAALLATTPLERLRNVMLSALVLGGFLGVSARAPTVGAGMGLLFILYIARRRASYVPKMVFATIVIVLLVGIVLHLSGIETYTRVVVKSFNRFMRFADDPHADHALQFRLQSWGMGLMLWKENPFFGIGIGSFPKLSETVFSMRRDVVHSVYLEVLVTLGVIGLLLMLLLFLRMALYFRKGFREIRSPTLHLALVGICGVFVAKLFTGIFYGLFVEEEQAWIALGLAFAVMRIGVEDVAKQREKGPERGRSYAFAISSQAR